jgi:Cathepsin propeptide inhibitor domain (I29)
MHFLAKHGKTYATKNDMNSRYEIFAENFDKIEEHNANNEHFKKTINKFSDLTNEEFTHRYL